MIFIRIHEKRLYKVKIDVIVGDFARDTTIVINYKIFSNIGNEHFATTCHNEKKERNNREEDTLKVKDNICIGPRQESISFFTAYVEEHHHLQSWGHDQQ